MGNIFLRRNIMPKCIYCGRGRRCKDTDLVVCPKRGIVNIEDNCRSFKYDPLKRCPEQMKKSKQYSPEDFKI